MCLSPPPLYHCFVSREEYRENHNSSTVSLTMSEICLLHLCLLPQRSLGELSLSRDSSLATLLMLYPQASLLETKNPQALLPQNTEAHLYHRVFLVGFMYQKYERVFLSFLDYVWS